MAKTKIRGITIEIGGDVSPLNKALKSTNEQLNSTQKELRDIERLLKMDPTNTELLEQKQRKLAQSIEHTSDKLQILREAEQDVQEQMKKGKASQEQYDALQREIVAAENSLTSLKSEAQKAENALDGISEKPLEEVADAADDAGDELKRAEKEAADFGDVLKAELVVEGVKSIASAISDVADETAEYRKIMASLEVSSKKAGYSAEETGEAYRYLYGILGDDQTAATTVANLQALELSQSELKSLIEDTVGAWATCGDSIPIDGLAESINETAKTAQVTGTFADVLNWGSKEGETFGIKMKEATKANEEWNKAVSDCKSAEDFFNLALQECSTQAERVDLIMRTMANQGLRQAAQEWRKNNQDIIGANEAQSRFMDTASQLAEQTAPAVTAVKEGFTDLLEQMVSLTEQVDMDAWAQTIDVVFACVSQLISFVIENGPLILGVLLSVGGGLGALKLMDFINQLKGVSSAVSLLTTIFPGLSSAIALLTNPIFLVGAAITGFVLLVGTKGDEIQAILQKLDDWMQNVFLTDWTEIFGPGLGNILNGFFATYKNIWDSVMRVLHGIIDFIRGIFTGDWERAWQGVCDIFGGMFGSLEALAKAPINAVISLINGMLGAINWVIEKVNTISFENPFTGETIGFDFPTIPNIPYLAKGGVLSKGSAIVGEAGPELLTVLSNGKAQVTPLNASSSTVQNIGGGLTVNVYAADESTDAYEFGRKIGEEAARIMRGRGIVI